MLFSFLCLGVAALVYRGTLRKPRGDSFIASQAALYRMAQRRKTF